MTHEYTHVPASKDVCGRVDKKRLAYATVSMTLPDYSPCPTMSEKQAIPKQVMNHKNRFQLAGIRREKLSPRKLPSAAFESLGDRTFETLLELRSSGCGVCPV